MTEAEAAEQSQTDEEAPVLRELRARFPQIDFVSQATRDGIPTVFVPSDSILDVLRFLKTEIPQPYRLLYDLTAIDERIRNNRQGQPPSDFTVVYHLISYDRNADLRLKAALTGDVPSTPSAVPVFPVANWYEREAFDMFGIIFEGHPHLTRILMPYGWQGHPLRKDHPARATELPPFTMTDEQEEAQQRLMQFRPDDWGMVEHGEDVDYMFLNLGPQHPGTHGILRVILQLDGERILDAVPDIGYHHRGAEKMGERQSWHTYIPYTDRVEYLGGVMNNFPYVMAVEKLAGIEVPDRVKVIRIMMAELFRIQSHLVWWGTFAGDVGALSPVFYMFTDREKAFSIVEAICGARMHPSWFRIGGVAHDLPDGWEQMMREFVAYMPKRIKEYEGLVMGNRIFKIRTQGVGAYTLDEAIEWGVTGPGLRACGFKWDWRKNRPYSGYDQFDFEIPTATHGDSYDRAAVRVEEMRQSLRIIQQCIDNMPSGPFKSDHPLTTPPIKKYTMHDIETLITHFLEVSWGPVIPPGEASAGVEATKGNNSYYLISDGSTMSYRTRIRSPSFAHMQMLPLISRGDMIPDIMAILGSMDYVLSDVDR
jgi:NADH-quinone oxidoreductase subunit C/D